MDTQILLFLLLAAAAGLAAGWFLGTRQAALYRRERDQRVEDFKKAITDLADMQARLDEARQACADARTECARLSSAHEAQERNFQERLAELKDARETLSAQFSEIGGKLLGEAQKNFLERADARFNQAGEKSKEQLKALLQPVEATLKRYEEGLSKVEKERVGSYEALREAVTLLHSGHMQVRDETARLVNALRSSPKARGQWGEQSLKNVLEQAGLSPYADFQTEVSVNTDEGRLRPDVIVRLPGGRKLIIDAKCSLNAYLDASEEIDEAARTAHLQKHAASIRLHAQQLGSKNYWEQFGDAADYVVLYIPGEHFLTAALEQD